MAATRKRRVKVDVSLFCQTLVATEMLTSSDLTHLSINKLILREMRKHLQSDKFNIVNVNLWAVIINVSTAITNSGKSPDGALPKSTVFRVGVN